ITVDYHILSSLIRAASFDPWASETPNLWFNRPFNTMLGNYFDLLSPIANRLFDLTHDPFRLLSFHALLMFAGPLFTWWLAIRHPSLQPFQLILPTALALHPAMTLQLVSD